MVSDEKLNQKKFGHTLFTEQKIIFSIREFKYTAEKLVYLRHLSHKGIIFVEKNKKVFCITKKSKI